jgi:flagellar biosynthetic protein FlhB
MAAGETLPEQRTEMPTDRRLQELRKEGAIFHSSDVEHVLVFITGFFALSAGWNALYADLKFVMSRSFTMIGESKALDAMELRNGFIALVKLLAPDIFLITVAIASVAALSVMLQTNWNRRAKWFRLRWDFLNPIGGIKRIVSIAGLVNVFKAVVKLALVLPVAYYALQAFVPQMIRLVHMSIPDVFSVTGLALQNVFWKMMYIFIALAVFDVAWGKFQWLKRNKMTKQEVKDERKAIEGDESMRRKIISKGMSRLAQKLKKSVPTADVVVTNPTHYAVALKYDRGRHAAPIVVAKGTDFIAQRIREIARESGVPVLERKALARALHASTEVGSEIPRDLFKAVAEVLAYVYRLKNPYAYSGAKR